MSCGYSDICERYFFSDLDLHIYVQHTQNIQRQIPKEEPLLFCILPQKVDVRTMTNAQCNSSPWMPINEVEPDSICAADIGKGFCLNDAGGPLITNEGKFFSIIGKNN